MHDIWNPWHGCVKKSEGCDHCYMYYLDGIRGQDGSEIYKSQNKFDYPLHKRRDGSYAIRSGEQLRVCMTSDFFLEQADQWRPDAWSIIGQRPDVIFYLLTKRPERAAGHMARFWGDGWDNVSFNVTMENQERADERIPYLLDIKAKHKGIMVAPFIGPVNLEEALKTGTIEKVVAGGENYDGSRPCSYDWVLDLRKQCIRHNTTFCFIETGSLFIKDGKTYHLQDKTLQSQMAFKSGTFYQGRKADYEIKGDLGLPMDKSQLYKPYFNSHRCSICGSRPICNGCSRCQRCQRGSV